MQLLPIRYKTIVKLILGCPYLLFLPLQSKTNMKSMKVCIWLLLLITSNNGWALSENHQQKNDRQEVNGDFLGLKLPSTGTKWPFPTGAIWVNVGSSIGYFGFPSYGNRRGFLPIEGNIEYSFDPHWAVGPYLGFYSVRYADVWAGESYSSRLSRLVMGGRLTFHGTDVLNQELGADIDVKQWDIYASLTAGIVAQTWRVDSKFKGVRNFDSYAYPTLGLILGAKYFVSPTFAVHAETGKGTFGFLNFGVSFWVK